MNHGLHGIQKKLGLKALDHIGIAVENLDEAASIFTSFWPGEAERVDFSEAGMRMALFSIPGTRLELIQGDEGTAINKYVAKRGGGLHHLAFRVEDVEAEAQRAREIGIRTLTGEPQRGMHGTRVMFLHPKDTGGVLIELVQGPHST